jgi:hypothetical protein
MQVRRRTHSYALYTHDTHDTLLHTLLHTLMHSIFYTQRSC